MFWIPTSWAFDAKKKNNLRHFEKKSFHFFLLKINFSTFSKSRKISFSGGKQLKLFFQNVTENFFRVEDSWCWYSKHPFILVLHAGKKIISIRQLHQKLSRNPPLIKYLLWWGGEHLRCIFEENPRGVLLYYGLTSNCNFDSKFSRRLRPRTPVEIK